MGTFNSLYYTYVCPMCNERHEAEIQFRFGYRNQIEYKFGDKIDWGDNKPVWEPYYTLGCGIRPENGNYVGEGYVVCEAKDRDYFVDIIVENDIIVAVKYRPDKKGYTPSDK